jgi:hypothetical protein
MLVGLEGQVKHLTSLIALLVHQLVTDGEKTGECRLHNLIKVLSIIAVGRFIAERTADGEQTLQTSKNGTGVIRV